MAQFPITLKMRRHRRGSGTNRTRGYHSSRHRHENKRVRVEERALERVRQDEGIQVADSPMPLIDMGIDCIDELIRSVIDARFEDSIQDAWVRVIEERPTAEEDILRIAKEVSTQNAKRVISEKWKCISGDAPLRRNDGGITKTSIFDLTGEDDEEITFILNDYQPEATRTVVSLKANPLTRFLLGLKTRWCSSGYLGRCRQCRQNALLNGHNLCIRCNDSVIDDDTPAPLRSFLRQLGVRNDNGHYDICIRCNSKAFLDKQRICCECSDYIINNGLNSTTALIPCLVCRSMIYVSRWEIKQRPRIYCSRRCARKAQGLKWKGIIKLRNDKRMCEAIGI